MSLRRHILQVVALVTAVALVFGAFAGSASAAKMTKKQKAEIRKQLKKAVKKNPGVVKRRAFLKKAALVNFVLPVTIRLRNKCEASNALGLASCASATSQAAGTALNQETNPNATVNLGPSLGSRSVNLGGSLAAEVQFKDSYDGGALGNVSLKILPSPTKVLKTNAVPLLWNPDITDTSTRSDANFAKSNFRANNPVSGAGSPQTLSAFATAAKQGCGDWSAAAQANPANLGVNAGETLPGSGYLALFHGANFNFPLFSSLMKLDSGLISGGAQFFSKGTTIAGIASSPSGLTGAGLAYLTAVWPSQATTLAFIASGSGLSAAFGGGTPGYTVFDTSSGVAPTTGGLGYPNSVYALPIFPGGDNAENIVSNGITGSNDSVGPNPNPFPASPGPNSDPTNTGPLTASNTVLRTNALQLGIANSGTYVDLATGTGAYGDPSNSGLPTGEGSQTVTVGQSGGEANLFGNIPGKSVGIDVTVSLATRINSIIRIMDQDVFDSPSLYVGGEYPAGIFNCRQIWTGAVQNYIPGVRLTGSLRIAPAITKDGKLRIARAKVSTSPLNPARVALSACLMPYAPYNAYTGADNAPTAGAGGPRVGDNGAAFTIPSLLTAVGGGAFDTTLGLLGNTNTSVPVLDAYRHPPVGPDAVQGAPSDVKCNENPAKLIRDSALGAATVNAMTSGALNPNDGYTSTADGSRATVAGDISVKDLDVDVLIGNQ